MCRLKKSGASPRAHPSSKSSSFSSQAILPRYSSHRDRSSGTSAGHTLGAYHSALTTGSSNGSRVAKVSDSFRSGRVSVPSEYPLASAPGPSQPRPPTFASYACLTSAGSVKNARGAAGPRARGPGSPPCPGTSRNPAVCRASSTVRAMGARTSGSPSRHGRRSMVGIRGSVTSDVLIPQSGVLRDEVAHQCRALGVVEDDHLDAVLGEPVVSAVEGDRLADHHPRDTELPDQPAAVPAGGQGGDHGRPPVRPLPSRRAEGGRLRVHRGIVVLDAAVVAAAEEAAVGAVERGTDRDTALGEPGAGLGDGGREPGVCLCLIHASTLL